MLLLQYTCFDASHNYIVCGASSGSIYIFQRSPCKFLQLIPSTSGPISNIAISPNDRYVAFCSQKGTILLYVVDFTATEPQVVQSHYRDTAVTCLQWKQNESQFFYGDKKGNVFLVNLNVFLVRNPRKALLRKIYNFCASFQGRNLSNISIHPILFLESPVVQISDCDQLLLVSNYTKCILCNTDTEEFKQIGNQPRDGKFGASFLTTNPTDIHRSTKIFCARPGCRIWECDLDGNVMQTHKFKPALKAKQATSIRPTKPTMSQFNGSPPTPTIDSLTHLQPILKRFVLGYTETSFYIFDLKSSAIVLWNNEFEHIDKIKVIDECDIVIFTKNSEAYSFQIHKLNEIFFEMLSEQDFLESGRFLVEHSTYFKERLNDDKFMLYLSILKNKLKHMGEAQDLLEELKGTFDEVISSIIRERDSKDKEQIDMIKSRQLENGIYLVENSYAAVVKRTGQTQHNRAIINGSHSEYKSVALDDNNDDIVAKKPTKKKANERIPHILMEAKPLTEEEKTVRSLFFIYKSLRISSFNMVERYASTFDQYDVAGIANLLQCLTEMIVENEPGTDTATAQRYCYEMYFNYLNPELIWEFDETTRDFIVNAFITVNSPRPLQVCDKTVQRCELCDFPLAIEMFVLKYKSVGETLIKYLWSRNERRKCFDIVTKVPIVLTTILKLIVNDQLGVDLEHEDRESVERLVDILFACADKGQLERCIRHNGWFREHLFWDLFFKRLARLHSENKIICVDCGQLSTINNYSLGSSKSFYSFDYAMQLCADHMDGLDALRFSKKFAYCIKSDAMGRDFFLKCLLNS